MTRKSQSYYRIYRDEMPRYGETERRRNSPTGKQRSPADRTHHPSSRTSPTSSISSRPASVTPILREWRKGSWQELAWERKPPNSMSTTSDSIRPRVDTTTSGSSSSSAMDSHHGFEPESASSTPHSLHSSNGKKKQSSSTDRRGWIKQSNRISRIDKDTNNPPVQTPH